MKNNIIRRYVYVFAGDLGRLIVFAAFIPLLVRIVGESGFGVYALVMALFVPLRKILNFGLFDAIKTYVPRTESDCRPQVISAAFWLHIVTLLIGIPTAYTIVTIFPTTDEFLISFIFVLTAVVGSQFFNFGRGVLHSYQLESLVEPLILVRSLLLAVIGLSLAHFGNWGVPGVFAGFAIGFLFTGFTATILAIQRTEFRLRFNWSAIRNYAKILLQFGFPSMVLLVLTVGLYKIDILLVSYFRTSAETGFYRAALQVAEFIWAISIGMEKIMIQSTSDLWKKNDTAEITDITSRLLKYVVLLTVIVLIGIFVLSGEFLSLYFGPGYVQSVTPLRILLPGVLAFAIARSVWPVVQASGNLRLVVLSTLAAVVCNAILNVILIPKYGIKGAAIATSISYVLMGIFHVKSAHQVSIQPLRNFPTGRVGIISLITACLLFLLKSSIPTNLRLLIIPPLGFIIYIFGVIVTKVLAWENIIQIINLRSD